MAEVWKRDVWDLRLSTSKVVDASDAWLALKTNLETTADALATTGDAVRPRWESPVATSYFEHLPKLIAALRSAAAVCRGVTTALDDVVTDVNGAKTALRLSLDRLRDQMTVIDLGGMVWFRPEDDAEDAAIADEFAVAQSIVDGARSAVDAAQILVRDSAAAIAGTRLPWSTIASSGRPSWDAPDGSWAVESSMIEIGGSTLVTGTGGSDDIVVTIDAQTGDTLVTVGAVVHRIARGRPVVISAGAGQDRISVPHGTTVHLRFLGGADDDHIDGGTSLGANDYFGGRGQDSIEAGVGHDFLSGGAGRDYLDGRGGDDRMFGGHGNDVLYAMGGDDVVDGGGGNDYLEGGAGADRIFGSDGDDQVSGGTGDDTLHGGGGQDVMFGGEGSDTVHGQGGYDELYVGRSDESSTGARLIVEYAPSAGEHIVVTGSPEFVARVQADLDMMRSSPVGIHTLETLGQQYEDSDGFLPWDHKVGLEIHEFDENNGVAYSEGSDLNSDGYAIEYNPDYFLSTSMEKVPVVVLYHELGHVFQYGDDSWPDGEFNQAEPGGAPDMVPNSERQNVGLPWDSDGVDADEVQPDSLITENAFRDHLGLPRREKY